MLAPFLLTKITTITKIIVVMSKKVHNLDGSCRGQKGKETPAGVYNKGKKCRQEIQQCLIALDAAGTFQISSRFSSVWRREW